MKHLKLYEQNHEIDPFNEERYNEKKVIKPITWVEGDYNIHYAFVGNLLIGCYFMPKIEKMIGKKYHIRIGFGIGELIYTDKKFKTEEECIEYISNWWKEFVDKICY